MIRSVLLSAVLGLFGATAALAHPPRPVLYPPPVLVEPPAVVVHSPPVFVPPQPVYTLETFARDFRPIEGRHHILIVHPVTKCPVEVCFDLPCGKLRELDVNRRSIEFDFGRDEVKIVFRHNGKVDVKY